MPATFDYTVKVTLPIGEVTIEAEYYQGHMGSYWVPPDPDEVIVHKVIDASGQEVTLTDAQYEEYYNLMLEAVSVAHSAYLDKEFNKFTEEYLASQDTEIPF